MRVPGTKWGLLPSTIWGSLTRKSLRTIAFVKRTLPHSTMQEQGDDYGMLPVLSVFHICTVLKT